MAIRSGGQAPYAPPQAVLGLLQAYRNRPIQPPFTTEVLEKIGVKASLIPRVKQSLLLLDLIDKEDMPTAELEGLRRAAQAEFKPRLAALVQSVYAEIFQYFDPQTDDEEKARDIFRHYEPLGQLTRVVRLFMALCDEAGLLPEGRRKPVVASPPRTNTNATKRDKTPIPARPPSVSARAHVRTDTGGFIPPAIMGVLAGLPTPERGWTQAERDHFYMAFGALLDYSIPIKAARVSAPADEDGDDDE